MTEDSFGISISAGSVALSSPGGADAELTLTALGHAEDVLAAKQKQARRSEGLVISALTRQNIDRKAIRTRILTSCKGRRAVGSSRQL